MNDSKTYTKDEASKKLQRAWRSHTNKKIYKYYKDLIILKTAGNPRDLLKSINPGEAQLLETASNLHIRFRLGGDRFPPTIYYKIYTHGALCDVNSFAPRDYSTLNKPLESEQRMTYKDYKKDRIHHDGWYLRFENNGWRPLQHKFQKKKDFVEISSANKVRYYHHKKEFRSQKDAKHKRLNKLRWFQKMYEKARQEEETEDNKENPFDNSKFLDIDDDEFDSEVKDLLEWSENLDFDKYHSDWQKISTSDKTENYTNSMKRDLAANYDTRSMLSDTKMQSEINNIPPKY